MSQRARIRRQSGSPLRCSLLVLLGLALSSCVSGRSPSSVGGPGPLTVSPPSVSSSRVHLARLTLPLRFEANHGQVSPEVKFVARGNGYRMLLASTEAVLAVKGRGSEPTRLALLGANPNAPVEGMDRLPGVANYFIGDDPTRWLTRIPTYAAVRYRDVYPGIDLVYHGDHGRLEFDLVIAPGADPAAIRLAVAGAGTLLLDGGGDVVWTQDGRTRVGLLKPVVYQEVDGRRREIAVEYRLVAEDQLGFTVAAYDSSRPLVIDPVIVSSTYLGGSSEDLAADVGVDAAGNVYLAGSTTSVDYPTVHPLQGKSGTFRSTFVSKLDPTGTTLLYSTYIGGNGDDPCFGMAVDSAGNAYVTGPTTSTSFPTMNAFQRLNAGSSDVFLTKLNPTGDAILYSTFLGGSGTDATQAVAVNDAGQAWVGGMTMSANFPIKNPAQFSLAGGADAFVARFDTTQSGVASLVYSTYFGGTGDEMVSGLVPDTPLGRATVQGAIAVDGAGNAYLTGPTSSVNLPVKNAFQPFYGGGTDVFVAKFDPAGAKVYATYLGGSGLDVSFGIATDAFGNAYVVGQTFSPNFPTKTPIQPALLGGQDAFITKLAATGMQLVYSTFLGGSNGGEFALRVAVDAVGSAFVTGQTSAADFPLARPVQATYGGGPDDAWVAQVHPSGLSLVFSTFLGGLRDDIGVGVAPRPDGSIWVVTQTTSLDFPVVSALQPNLQGGTDSTVTRIGAPSGLVAAVLPTSRSVQTNVTATAFAAMLWTGPGPAVGCTITPTVPLSADFLFQTTDANNQFIGRPNTAVNIGAGAVQNFFIAFTPTAAFAPVDVALNFGCLNTGSAPVISGVDTLLLSASDTPVPDIVAVGATTTNDGIVTIPGIGGTGFMVVATTNVGAGGLITVSADTGNVSLPVSVFVCQTDPAGVCMAPLQPAVNVQINAHDTPTFAVFVRGSGRVAFDPATNRLNVRFKDGAGVTRGSTGAALRTTP